MTFAALPFFIAAFVVCCSGCGVIEGCRQFDPTYESRDVRIVRERQEMEKAAASMVGEPDISAVEALHERENAALAAKLLAR